jgi:hypothetical protein
MLSVKKNYPAAWVCWAGCVHVIMGYLYAWIPEKTLVYDAFPKWNGKWPGPGDLLLRLLPGTPVLSVKTAVAMLGRSKPQVNEAVARLETAGILRQLTAGRRNRAFEARDVIDAFAELERQLASPAGDTVASPPARPVPARRQ